MLNLFVNGEGGLTTAGYALSAALLVLSILAGLALADRGGKKGFAAKQLAYCAMAVALAYVTSFIRVFKLPYGGSVTLLSMLFIVLVANWYGVKTGMLVGFAYGILQFLQEPYFLTLFQVCCDYVLAFAALGLAGLFRGKKNSLLTGYIAAVLARGCSTPSGATSTGWTTCRKTSPWPCGTFTPSFTTTAIYWRRRPSPSLSSRFRRWSKPWSGCARPHCKGARPLVPGKTRPKEDCGPSSPQTNPPLFQGKAGGSLSSISR